MSVVSVTIDIDATPQQVWDVIMDPERYGDWVTIHRKLCRVDEGEPCRKGFKMDQRLVLRGAPFTVHWTLTEVEEPKVGTFEGKGPAGSYARVSNRLRALDGGGTCFGYENEFKAPGGAMGALASRVLVGGMPEREANKSLKQLKRLLEKDSSKPR